MKGPHAIGRRARSAFRRHVTNRALILIYHRVSDVQIDPWRLCVSPHNFAQQLEVLRRLRLRIVHVSALARDLEEGKLRRRTVAITFDDGYSDNLEHARPILNRYGAPATLFATAGYIGGDQEFWWDVLERIFLQPGRLPPVLELTIRGEPRRWDLGDTANLDVADSTSWLDWRPMGDAPTARHRIHDELWRMLADSEPEERGRVIADLLSWAGLPANARASHRPLTAAELRAIGRGGLFEVGAHSFTHPALGALPPEAQAHELSASKARLEELMERPVIGCSYPNGRSDEQTEIEARNVGYAFACGSTPEAVTRRSNLYQLPRVSSRNWSAERFEAFLRAHIAA